MAWNRKLDVSDVFHNDELTLVQKTTTITARIKGASWGVDYGDLPMILEELTDAAEAGDVEWWDAAWDGFYDYADDCRVWVVTR